LYKVIRNCLILHHSPPAAAIMTTMKQVVGIPGKEVKCRLESAPIPEAGDKQVLIKVVVSGSNPKGL